MAKRVVLFLVTNLAIVLTVSLILNLLGVGRYVGPNGLDLRSLAIFCFVWGMAGSIISLLISRWMAKRSTGMQLVNGQHRRRHGRLAVPHRRAADAQGQPADARGGHLRRRPK